MFWGSIFRRLEGWSTLGFMVFIAGCGISDPSEVCLIGEGEREGEGILGPFTMLNYPTISFEVMAILFQALMATIAMMICDSSCSLKKLAAFL